MKFWVQAGVAASIISLILYIYDRNNTPAGGELKTPSQVVTQKVSVSTNSTTGKPSYIPESDKGMKSVPLSKGIAVLVVENKKTIDWTLSSTISSILEKNGVTITHPSLFKESFLSGGRFDDLFNGGSRKVLPVELPGHFKTGVLGRKTVEYFKSTDFPDLITASMSLELHVISSKTGAIKKSISFSQKGAGFSNGDASKNAEEKIVKEIEIQFLRIVDVFKK